jgi:polysaccharide pyruvyl transferase WcaK-like protein
VVAEYDTFIRGKDLALGFRVHGNLPALANGVPAIFVEYDQRSSELAETFSIPHLTMDDIAAGRLEQLYRADLWDRFNERYRDHYRRMRAFLDRNGMAHRLVEV